MKKFKFLFILPIFFLVNCNDRVNQTDGGFVEHPADHVNPFVGTDAHGHTHPGASVPFGMVQLSPDTRLEGWDGCSGYHYSDSVLFGFSHTALSGTGVPDYADILFMPTVGEIRLHNGSDDVDKGYASRFSHERETAEAGYYSVHLDDYGVHAELTASKRTGFHQYTYTGEGPANVIIDLDHRDKVVDSWLRQVGPNRVEGYRRSTAWAADQHLYFAAEFSVPFKSSGLALNDQISDEDFIRGENVKAFFQFDLPDNKTIQVKVALSAVSPEGAWKNLQSEMPDWDFGRARRDAWGAWDKELSKIQVKGGVEEQVTTFYTALYHAFLVPNLFMDVDGSYLGRDLQVHQSDGFDYYTVFSLWDTFRGEHPLFTLIQQERTIDFIKTMIAQYEQGGRLPVWELAANETECMIGYHAIPVIVDAWMKGIRGFDVEKAYEAMKHSAELDHFGLEFYKEKGYIPAHEESESVSKTLEYAYDDWCIAIMARALGHTEDYERYMKRAQSYKNIFDPSTGFMRARMNGRWFEPFDPKEVNFNYTEANSWQYSFFVPQDVSGLIELLGGREEMINRLDQLFEENSETTGRQQSDITGLVGQYAHGNEPSHHMAYLYNYLGQPWKTQQRARQIMDELYTPLPDGLCGNEDCGQMSAWYVLSAMGFYSVTPGVPFYVLGSPLFDEVKINLENGQEFIIRAVNNSPQNKYVQAATLNGQAYSKSFITHQSITDGGALVLEMDAEPNKAWGTSDGDLPVSYISDHLITPVPFVKTGDRTFVKDTEVSLGSTTAGGEIYYTLDGSAPTMESAKYTGPFVLDGSATLKAFIRKKGIPNSGVLTAEFHKIPVGRTITLNTAYANQYSGGGNLCLIDFIRGPLNFRTGAWQGYQGVDLDAVVDLGSIKLINKLETGFLQDVGAWIFMPLEVQYHVSNDGANFQHIGTVKNEVSHRMLGVNIQNFTLNFSTKARYVKVIAKNQGTCPDWHVGEGQPAWIFADEVVIE
jgi:predicted alpha-1,2-mannosidase